MTAGQIASWRKTVRRIVLWWSCALDETMPYQSFDLILSCIPGLVEQFRSRGLNAEYMPHAFDVRIHDRVAPRVGGRVRRVAFVGALSAAHRERVGFSDALSREVEIDFFGSGADLLPRDSPLRARVHAPVWGTDLYRVYGSYALAVHKNSEAAGSSASAKRLFEATGMGAAMVAEDDPWLPRLFDPASEIVTYDSVASCAETITHLLADEAAVTSVAARGQRRTLHDHTYEARVRQFTRLVLA